MKMTCIMCPMGCQLTAEIDANNQVKITGNTCARGATYGKQEYTSPMRVVTSLVKLGNDIVVPVKTSDLVPKSAIFDILKEIGKVSAKAPIKIGDIMIKNVLNLNVDIVATKNIE